MGNTGPLRIGLKSMGGVAVMVVAGAGGFGEEDDDTWAL